MKIRKKPALLDDIVLRDYNTNDGKARWYRLINGKFYFRKMKPYYSMNFLTKLYYCYLILKNRAFPFQYAEDYFKK